MNYIDRNCPKCGLSLSRGMSLHNIPENCEERISYPYMKIGESMHFECYIQKVIDEYLHALLRYNDKK